MSRRKTRPQLPTPQRTHNSTSPSALSAPTKASPWTGSTSTRAARPTPSSYLYQSCPPNQPTAFNPPGYAPTAAGQWGVGGRCIPPKIAASGVWCPSSQPEYSRWRKHAYGVGMLDILSPTKAVWAF